MSAFSASRLKLRNPMGCHLSVKDRRRFLVADHICSRRHHVAGSDIGLLRELDGIIDFDS